MKIVAIGDMHAHPDYDNKRFEIIGEFAAEELATEPDGYVVQIGDWADCVAFNTHGTKLEMEGTRWVEDIEVTRDSLDKFMRPFYRRKRKMPKRVLIMGNHEKRADRYVTENPHLEGIVGSHQLGFEDFGFKVQPFNRPLDIGGFKFVHHMMGQSPRPIRVNSPSNGFIKRGSSYVTGHTHIAGHWRHNFEDRTVHGIDLGCAIHKNMGHQENWSCQSAHKYDRGVWVFDNVENGDADIRYVRLETLGA
jgi:hypothetical protein